MQNIKAKIKGYALIIDKYGRPRIDDPLNVPDIVWNNLSQEHKNHVNSQVQEHLRRFD